MLELAKVGEIEIPSDVDEIHNNLIAEAEDIINDSSKSHQIHIATAKYFSGANWALGTGNVALAAIAGSTQLKNMNVNPTWVGSMCLVVAVITAVIAFWKIDARSRDHYHAGNLYKAISQDAAHFMNVESKMSISIEEKVKKLEGLSGRIKELNVNSPLIPWFALMLIRISGNKNKLRRGKPDIT
jgi:hypothetical protein